MQLWNNVKKNSRTKRHGLFTLELVMLITILVIGILGGLAAVRNAISNELVDVAESIESISGIEAGPPVAPSSASHTPEDITLEELTF
ncbi:MAG: hypothetical protein MPJ24_07005 [Pirellulaceae bacterium]|nr:hypothetical protein [Pirellulaceae bacterium]